jgi:hypothetical protein
MNSFANINCIVTQGKDEGPGSSYLQVEQFILGSPDEIKKELPKMGCVNFPPYPRDARGSIFV